ncbi:MAG: phage major capsid protein [Pseudonocardia sp.]|nr:phage major capsid protein [Pseudonocardia sp.]
MQNKHLAALIARYNAERDAVTEIQTRAAADGESGRDLTADEASTVENHVRAATALAGQIEAVHAQELRNQQGAAAAAAVQSGEQVRGTGADEGTSTETRGESVAGDQGGAGTSSTTTRPRDPGHYTKASGSFFGDLVRSREGDEDARKRLDEHNRALSTTVSGAGITPPKWLTDEYESLARQGRMVSAAVRQVPLGDDPRPMTLPRQTTGTDTVLAEQATENTHPSEVNAFATTVDTVIPKPISGIQVVSRQMLDSSQPAVDALIYGDMLAVYNRQIEDKVTAAMVAAAGTPVNTQPSLDANFAATVAADAIIDAAFAVWNARKLPATIVAMRVSRWGKFNKYRDTAGRKLYPTSDAGPQNVDGVGSVVAAGNVEGLPVIPTDGLGLGGATYPESILVARASDIILFEGNMLRFRYEEVAGPESVKLGVWAYSAVTVRQAANSVRRVTLTGA